MNKSSQLIITNILHCEDNNTDFYEKINISLGKEFRYIFGESQLSKDAGRIMDYLMEMYEIQDLLGKNQRISYLGLQYQELLIQMK